VRTRSTYLAFALQFASARSITETEQVRASLRARPEYSRCMFLSERERDRESECHNSQYRRNIPRGCRITPRREVEQLPSADAFFAIPSRIDRLISARRLNRARITYLRFGDRLHRFHGFYANYPARIAKINISETDFSVHEIDSGIIGSSREILVSASKKTQDLESLTCHRLLDSLGSIWNDPSLGGNKSGREDAIVLSN